MSMIGRENIHQALATLKTSLRDAGKNFHEYMMTGEEWYNPGWIIERCFLQLLTIVEAMGLPEMYNVIFSEYQGIQQSKEGFLKHGQDPEGEAYSIIISKLRKFLGASVIIKRNSVRGAIMGSFNNDSTPDFAIRTLSQL